MTIPNKRLISDSKIILKVLCVKVVACHWRSEQEAYGYIMRREVCKGVFGSILVLTKKYSNNCNFRDNHDHSFAFEKHQNFIHL